MIVNKLEVGPIMANCYIVGSEVTKEGMIIDPGAEAERIMKTVDDLGLDIKYIALTHRHSDHVGALIKVKEATGAEVAIHEDEVKPDAASPILNRLLKGGDSIDVGDLHFLVLHTPGHSQGGICLLGEGVVFTGDTLFNFSVGRSDFPGCSHSQLMNSIHTKLMILPDNTIVYPGHGPDSTIGTERRGNPFVRDA